MPPAVSALLSFVVALFHSRAWLHLEISRFGIKSRSITRPSIRLQK